MWTTPVRYFLCLHCLVPAVFWGFCAEFLLSRAPVSPALMRTTKVSDINLISGS